MSDERPDPATAPGAAPDEGSESAGGDTAAFSRYYLTGGEQPALRHGALYRIFVGWWRRG